MLVVLHVADRLFYRGSADVARDPRGFAIKYAARVFVLRFIAEYPQASYQEGNIGLGMFLFNTVVPVLTFV